MSTKNKKERQISRRIQVGEYMFHFYEADEQAYLYALKDGMDPAMIIFVKVSNSGGTIVAEFERVWEGHFNTAHVYNFMDKFAQDSKYRKTFQTSGEPILAELPKSEVAVNPQCAAAIRRINASRPGQLKFQDFAGLKTYGRDRVSGMKLNVLKDIVPEEEYERIVGTVAEEDIISVLRWIKRGLQIDHAIHKVKVDREISNNAVWR